MMNNRMLNVYSRVDFNDMMNMHDWSDDNIPDNCAFISICNANKSVCSDDELEHWFKQNSKQVINLDFDDIEGDDDMLGNCGMSREQAHNLVEFIIDNYGKHFYVHCSAGKSRSQGVSRFIQDCEKEIAEFARRDEIHYVEREDNKCMTPNWHVVSRLKNCWRAMSSVYFGS